MSKHTKTLAHAVGTEGKLFDPETKPFDDLGTSYALLYYPPCFHLARFQARRLERFLRLSRSNLRRAFGKERGDRWKELIDTHWRR
jgi:hypothetical protein